MMICLSLLYSLKSHVLRYLQYLGKVLRAPCGQSTWSPKAKHYMAFIGLNWLFDIFNGLSCYKILSTDLFCFKLTLSLLKNIENLYVFWYGFFKNSFFLEVKFHHEIARAQTKDWIPYFFVLVKNIVIELIGEEELWITRAFHHHKYKNRKILQSELIRQHIFQDWYFSFIFKCW